MVAPTGVDEYLAGISEEPRAALEELRATIRAVAPEATETISYQIPTFKDRGRMLVSYAAFKDHCSLFPASEGVIAACGDELTPHLHGKGTIRFTPDLPLSRALVRKIVEARLRENAALPRR